MKREVVAVFGGSFNPAHPGHFEMGRHIHRTLGVSEIWMMYSLNRFKDPAQYAPIEHRMKMGEILARHYPDLPFIMTDIETEVGTNETYFVLKELARRNPDRQFIWVMGADNLEQFHKWKCADKFIAEFPIAVVERPPYTEAALNSVTATTHAGLKVTPNELTKQKAGGWCFIRSPGQIEISSSALLRQLRAGQRAFPGPFQDVANYIFRHGLYGCPPGPGQGPSLKP